MGRRLTPGHQGNWFSCPGSIPLAAEEAALSCSAGWGRLLCAGPPRRMFCGKPNPVGTRALLPEGRLHGVLSC